MALRDAVLAALLEGEASGYDLAKRFDRSVANFWTATPQQLYRELDRLAADGLIEARVVPQQRRPTKRLYTLTTAGHDAIRVFTRQQPKPTAIRDDLLVMVQALDAGDATAIRDAVANQILRATDKLVLLERLRTRMLGDESEDQHLAATNAVGPYLTLLRESPSSRTTSAGPSTPCRSSTVGSLAPAPTHRARTPSNPPTWTAPGITVSVSLELQRVCGTRRRPSTGCHGQWRVRTRVVRPARAIRPGSADPDRGTTRGRPALPGLHDPRQRAKARVLVGHLTDDLGQERGVELGVGKGKFGVCASRMEVHVPVPGTVELSARLVQHLGLDVEEDQPAGGEPSGDLDAEEPRPRSDLHDAFATGETNRVDAGRRILQCAPQRVVQKSGYLMRIGKSPILLRNNLSNDVTGTSIRIRVAPNIAACELSVGATSSLESTVRTDARQASRPAQM